MSTSTTTPSIVLSTGTAKTGIYNWSPFVAKLETRLRFAKLPYTKDAAFPSAGPKGKIPFITLTPDPSNPTSPTPLKIGDSTLISKYLVQTGLAPDLNSTLSPALAAQELALRALLEEKMYFMVVRERWTVPANFYTMRDVGPLAPIPWPLRIGVGLLVYRGLARTLHGQGTLRYDDAEVDALLVEAWDAIATVVQARMVESGGKTGGRGKAKVQGPVWVFGADGPSEVDTTLFGALSCVLSCPANPRSQEIVRSHPVLLEYANRIHDVYFPDFEKWDA